MLTHGKKLKGKRKCKGKVLQSGEMHDYLRGK